MVEDKVTGKRMIAHINASGKIQTVKSHSEGTACLTQQFAEEFGCGKQGYFCGLLHDIGKYSEAFQRRIADPEHTAKVDHSTAGAVEAMKMAKENIPFAMAIPYLEPCVAAIADLAAHDRSTIVLCTATQPVLDEMIQKYLPQTQVREICEHTDILFQKLRRTSIVVVGNMEREKLIDCLTAQEQVLCIVNSRKLAQELFEEIPREGAFCLTTLLYPEHRKEKLREIKERLEHHVPCRVIATSLVEAGVDLDFPCVYRQENGLDALIQAAGRCNREGTHSPEESKVYPVSYTHLTLPTN